MHQFWKIFNLAAIINADFCSCISSANSESGSPERRLGCQGTQELDGSSQWLADQNEAGSQHALEQDASTTTAAETVGTRGKEQERIKMQTSPPQQHHMLHAQVELEVRSTRVQIPLD